MSVSASVFLPGGLMAQHPGPIDQDGNFERPTPELRLQEVMTVDCRVDTAVAKDALLALERQLSETVSSVKGWGDLACLRLRLGQSGVPAREGYLMPLGTGWLAGSLNVLRQVLTTAPQDPAVMELYAAAAMVASGIRPPASPEMRPVRPTDRDPASMLGVLLGAMARREPGRTAWLGCTALALDADDFTTAQSCSRSALEVGFDSTWHLLRLAYVAARTKQPLAAVRHLEEATLAARTPADRAILGWHLEWRSVGFFEDTSKDPRRWDLTPAWKLAWIAADDVTALRMLHTRLDELAEVLGRLVGRAEAVDYVVAHFHAIIHSASDFRTCNVPMYSPRLCLRIQWVPSGPSVVQWCAAVYRLWDGDGSHRVTVFPYAIETRRLPRSASDSLDMVFNVSRSSPADERDSVQFTVRQYVGPNRRTGDFSLGYSILPNNLGSAGIWRAIVSDDSGQIHGMTVGYNSELGAGRLALSDLLPSHGSVALEWVSGDSAYIVDPFRRFARGDALRLQFQVLSDMARDSVGVQLTLGGLTNTGEMEALVTIGWSERMDAGVNRRERVIQVPNVPAGRYRIQVELQAKGVPGIRRWVDVQIE